MWQTAAKVGRVGLDMYAAGEAAKAKQRQDMANAKLAMQMRTTAGNREGQAFMSNVQSLKDQNTADNFNISVAGMQARDNLAMATAGSGIAGASVDELSSDITRSVGRDKVAAKRNLDVQRDAMNVQRIQNNENRIVEAENAYVHDYTSDLQAAFVNSVGGAMSM
jgi:hypothetical protein